MNVFVLCSGRTASKTFMLACSYIKNYSAAHESRVMEIGDARLEYPDNHIEVDNRLSWFLGRLDEAYGQDAVYVHLKRDRISVADSYARRPRIGLLLFAYMRGIYLRLGDTVTRKAAAEDMVDTIESNINLFLKDKKNKMVFEVENADRDFTAFWDLIGAEGDKTEAISLWNGKVIDETSSRPAPRHPKIRRVIVKMRRLYRTYKYFLKYG